MTTTLSCLYCNSCIAKILPYKVRQAPVGRHRDFSCHVFSIKTIQISDICMCFYFSYPQFQIKEDKNNKNFLLRIFFYSLYLRCIFFFFFCTIMWDVEFENKLFICLCAVKEYIYCIWCKKIYKSYRRWRKWSYHQILF